MISTSADSSHSTWTSKVARPGTVVQSRYRLVYAIGGGVRDPVWSARTKDDERVAIKFLDPAIGEDSSLFAAFLSEARAAQDVDAEHIVRVLDHGVEAGLPYVVMEYLVGETLEARLSRERVLSVPTLEWVIRESCVALEALHRGGGVHGDLRPAKVFLALEGGRETLKLSLGIGRSARDVLDLTRSIAGATSTSWEAALYMSPERLMGVSAPDSRSDLWSLAMITLECLTGAPSASRATLSERLLQICSAPQCTPTALGDVPAGFDAWFERAVLREPSRRFASAREMAQALSAILQG